MEPASAYDITRWLQLIQSEYREMPGLLLTRSQVRRLWDLDDPTCDALLNVLIATRFLVKTPRGAYKLADATRDRCRISGDFRQVLGYSDRECPGSPYSERTPMRAGSLRPS